MLSKMLNWIKSRFSKAGKKNKAFNSDNPFLIL
jgi:hypothetical protein